MIPKIAFRSLLHYFLSGIFIIPAALLAIRSVQAAPLLQTVSQVLITNVNDVSFTVSWITDSASDGHVDWDTSTPPGMTASDPVASTTTHFVTVTGLSPNTTYFFQIRSGTTTDNNGGAYFSVTTGPALGGAPGTSVIFGQLRQVDNATGVPYGIVYFRLVDNDTSDSPGNSQWGAARADVNGDYFFNISRLRTEDLSADFVFTAASDQFQYVAQGGALGLVGEIGNEEIMTLPASFPFLFNIALDADPTAIGLTTVHAATTQPALILPGIALIVVLLLGASRLIVSRLRKRLHV